jgi:hypothetical protein
VGQNLLTTETLSPAALWRLNAGGELTGGPVHLRGATRSNIPRAGPRAFWPKAPKCGFATLRTGTRTLRNCSLLTTAAIAQLLVQLGN